MPPRIGPRAAGEVQVLIACSARATAGAGGAVGGRSGGGRPAGSAMTACAMGRVAFGSRNGLLNPRAWALEGAVGLVANHQFTTQPDLHTIY